MKPPESERNPFDGVHGPEPKAPGRIDQREHFAATLVEVEKQIGATAKWLESARDALRECRTRRASGDLVMAVHELTRAVEGLTRAQLNVLAIAEKEKR